MCSTDFEYLPWITQDINAYAISRLYFLDWNKVEL